MQQIHTACWFEFSLYIPGVVQYHVPGKTPSLEIVVHLLSLDSTPLSGNQMRFNRSLKPT